MAFMADRKSNMEIYQYNITEEYINNWKICNDFCMLILRLCKHNSSFPFAHKVYVCFIRYSLMSSEKAVIFRKQLKFNLILMAYQYLRNSIFKFYIHTEKIIIFCLQWPIDKLSLQT